MKEKTYTQTQVQNVLKDILIQGFGLTETQKRQLSGVLYGEGELKQMILSNIAVLRRNLRDSHENYSLLSQKLARSQQQDWFLRKPTFAPLSQKEAH